MKIMLISETASINNSLAYFCAQEHAFLVVYRLPLKALDNMSEIRPDIIVINAVDFPRHWKVLMHCLNSEYKNFALKKVLLIGANFNSDDFKKAEFLKVDLLLRSFTHGDWEKLKSV